jgi:hypothetical protein
MCVANSDRKAEFRGAIATTIPSLIKLLEDGDYHVRLYTIRVFGKLANYGEPQFDTIVAQLTRIVKPSLTRPSQPQFQRSLNSLKTMIPTFDRRLLE